MNNDIRPVRPRNQVQGPNRPPVQPLAPVLPSVQEVTVPNTASLIVHPVRPEIALEEPVGPLSIEKKPRQGRKTFRVICIFLIVAVVAVIGTYVWYQNELHPVSSDTNAARIRVTIKSGASPDMIANQLYDKKLIRSTVAFDIYTRVSGTKNKLQAGTFSLSPYESTQDIVKHLVIGKVDEFSLTFLPGATIADTRKVLVGAGFSESDVDGALKKSYADQYPMLFSGKPGSASLEGYIYGETYNFSASATVEDILMRTFDEMTSVIKQHNLIEGFQKQGLTLYQGITLASIIQRETSSTDPNTASHDQKQVAQVFYSRLSIGLPLGSDVTAYYGADQISVSRSVAVDTPYNTRIHTGLPPGPIAAPSLGALMAVAGPAAGDYLYFLSGDDNVTYFSHTNDEHERNITDHCKVKCSIP